MALLSSDQQVMTGEPSARSAKPEAAQSWLHRGAVSLLLFALFAECLYPLYSIVVEHERRVIGVFLCLTGVLLLIGCLRLAVWGQSLLGMLLIGGTLFYLFGVEEGISWLNGYGGALIQDIAAIFQTGRLDEASAESRMLLLLIGWSLLVVSVQMLAVSRQTILLFLSVAIVYLLTIEMIFEEPTFYNLVRTAGIGLGIQGYAFAMQLRENAWAQRKLPSTNGRRRREHAYGWAAILTILGLVAGAAGLALLLPAQPVQQRPLEALIKSLQSWYEQEGLAEAGAASSNVSGYGRDDGELGAPLKLRWETYFTAQSPAPVYWRGESKSVYTGRGWTQAALEGEGREGGDDLSLLSQDGGTASGSRIKQTITFSKPVSGQLPLFSGGIPVQVDRVFAKGERSVPFNAAINQMTGAIHLVQAGQVQQVGEVSQAGKLPQSSEAPETGQTGPGRPAAPMAQVERLEAAGTVSLSFPEAIEGYELTVVQQPAAGEYLRERPSVDPEWISKLYLQLPESLPERVRELGNSLVKDTDNRYDAVLSVVNYLKQHYSYNLNSAIPPEDEDFVDRFLFVDRQGYCDHFSTAMVVLLRSSGIPARWVKGFTPGERSKEAPDLYKVSYADAHSWVEVYFPEQGWILFDATPGFDSVLAASGGAESQLLPAWIREMARNAQGLPAVIKHIMDQAWFILKESWNKSPLIWSVGLLAIWPVFRLAAWISRNGPQWRNLWVLRGITSRPRSRFPDQQLLLDAADRVWQQLYRMHGYKPEGLTAREYVDVLAAQEPAAGGKLEEFVREWEVLYYGGFRPDRMSSRNFLELCRNLAHRRG